MNAADLDRVFGRGRLRMVTGEHVEVFREAAQAGERRRYTKRFLATASGDYRPWTEREWRILARLVGHGIGSAPEVVQFDRGGADRPALVQTYDAGITVDHWVTLLPVERDGRAFRHVFDDCAHWWALARQVLVALDAIHELKLVHLDLKADNVCIPYTPPDFDPGRPGALLVPRFDHLALIDFAFSLVSGEPLTSPLPIARQLDYAYQSPRLLHALAAGARGDLVPTRELDWRCDIFSLVAMLRRLLPDTDRAAAGWNAARRGAAEALLQRLSDVHDGAPDVRPHAELIALASQPLQAEDLRESLRRGWQLGRRSDAAPAAAPPTPITRIAPALGRVERQPDRATVPERTEAERSGAAGSDRWQPGSAPIDASQPTLVPPLPLAASEAAARQPATVAPIDRLPEPSPPADVIGPPGLTRAPGDASGPEANRGRDAAALGSEAGRSGAAGAPPIAIDPVEGAGRRDELERRQAERRRTQAQSWRIAAAVLVAAPLVGAAWLARQSANAPAAPEGAGSGPPRVVAAPRARDANRDVVVAAESAARAASAAGRASAASAPVSHPAGTPLPSASTDGARQTRTGADGSATPGSVGAAPAPPGASNEALSEGNAAGADARSLPPVAAPSRPLPPASSGETTEQPVQAMPPPARATPADGGAPRAAGRDFAARGDDLLARHIPRVAQRAERAVLRVLFAASQSAATDSGETVRAAARALPRAHDLDGTLEPAPREARALNEAARSALNRSGNRQQALRMQLGAFGANPLDPEVVGNTAFLLLRQPIPDAEHARELALHALTLRDPRFPTGRLEDWTSLAIASALSGREGDARNAWFVTLALTPNLERHCRGALNARALYGERVRNSIDAMFERVRAGGRLREAPSCDGASPQLASSRAR